MSTEACLAGGGPSPNTGCLVERGNVYPTSLVDENIGLEGAVDVATDADADTDGVSSAVVGVKGGEGEGDPLFASRIAGMLLLNELVERGDASVPSGSWFSSSPGDIDTDKDLASSRLRRCSMSSGRLFEVDTRGVDCSSFRILPTSPFLFGISLSLSLAPPLQPNIEEDELVPTPTGTTTLRLGIPGDVGGRANGAELIE